MTSIPTHKQTIARNFGRAASGYERHATFQRSCGEKLCSMLGEREGFTVLDAGCGTGWFSRFWKSRGNRVIALDLSAEMLLCAERSDSASTYILGDLESIPLDSSSVDLVFSNLAVQWCDSFGTAVSEFHRVLKPGGIAALSTLVEGSLRELLLSRERCLSLPHASRFLSLLDVEKFLTPYRRKISVERIVLHYPRLIDLLREIKGVGATYLPHDRRSRGLDGRRFVRMLEEHWPAAHPSRLSLSYRVMYGMIYRD